ncbi:hypothetical protein [Roseimicrobium sp. ORNL1]|uniref:hypothetical protein n=1 Tax=Roseimicrobium sp. ORNL1 TaxID=2711231 RepID=UPI0013E0EAF4|nr:hypothetical protein [Roseimicrobium sp. ORNL1]QIF03449.1 hypothetical protein G5S37_18595 [Roseimicrobium sp. ORNL1]
MSENSQPEPGVPIPREFHSEYEERPFQTCSRCGEALSTFASYQINKAFRKGECVFEYCFCEPCRDALLEEFSEESKANLMRHQNEHMRQDATSISACAFCGVKREVVPDQDFVITMLGAGLRMLDSLMICETCQLEMHELLSQKTRDVRRKFFEDLPGVPPDWEVWSPEEMEQHKHLKTTKTPDTKPVVKPTFTAKSDGRHQSEDGCMELIWAD